MASLLVNADDFGLHGSVNSAIAHCIERGVVNSVSIIPNGLAPDYNFLRGLEQAGIFRGAHITWVGERWLTENILIHDWRELGRRMLTGGKAFRTRLYEEAEAQINLLIEQKIHPDHIDSHQHVHLMPLLWNITRSLQRKYSINRIRVPKTRSIAQARNNLSGLSLMALSRLHKSASHLFVAGLKHSGNYNTLLFNEELKMASEVDTELIVHPGENNGLLNQRYSFWNFDWETEYNSLTDPGFLAAIQQNNFSLIRKA